MIDKGYDDFTGKVAAGRNGNGLLITTLRWKSVDWTDAVDNALQIMKAT